MNKKELLKITGIPVFVAGLCCFSPLLIFALGFSSVAAAADLADFFYGEWKWAFRAAGLFFLAVFLFFHFRKKGICTLDAAKRHRNKIINTILISLFVAILGYFLWLYVVVHFAGVAFGLWK